MRTKILVVDDEPRILKAVSESLERAGFVVATATDGESALEIFVHLQPDLVVLDVMLPFKDGFDVASDLRKQSEIPIVFLSVRGLEADKILAFKLGADDYVTKPFSPAELLLRIKAILRRASSDDRVGADQEKRVFPGLVADQVTRQVWLAGQPVPLTYKEFDLLWLLMQHPYRVFSREQLYERLWANDPIASPASITVIIGRLRGKIETEPATPQMIQTVWGVGYKFVPPVV